MSDGHSAQVQPTKDLHILSDDLRKVQEMTPQV